MTVSLAQNAIALLIDLAERGEIDPWDVKVIDVIDRFLSKLQPGEVSESVQETGRSPYEADLSQSGQAFLYASMLLLLKADSLARLEAEDVEEEEAEVLEATGLAPLPLNLERKLRRRAVAPPAPNRRVTLQELIAQLNLMAAAMADPRPHRAAIRRPRPQSRSQAIRAIAQLAHQENLSETAAALEEFLSDRWHEVGQGEEWVDFESLLHQWANSLALAALEPSHSTNAAGESSTVKAARSPTAHDRVGVFWALLFLSAQSKVELVQEEFYQDLRVRRLAPSATAAAADPSVLAAPES